MSDALITAIAALVGAVLGSGGTVAVLNWRFEKQRDKRTRQRELLASWRAGIDAWEREHPVTRGAGLSIAIGPDGQPSESITYCDWYQTLAPYLTIEVDPKYAPINELRREIHRIEREEWGLV